MKCILTKFKKSYPSVNPPKGSVLIHAHSHVPAVSTSANPGATENDAWLSVSQYLRLKSARYHYRKILTDIDEVCLEETYNYLAIGFRWPYAFAGHTC